ncbi:hypothetical protein LH450_03670 [Laribacter hongkongensis]|uniref:hypothetical protein n=1 Tax=Laribacter hongkongensis TaxID=168471 RepID=UPI001EFC301A|nr:hypothetical protein [Laribacter hongkongensis]MCG9000259.1 hypothetical protein [Laribacter hongkongensis]MCG9006649.1 hypothetical protein [Laribacter hongkongensis]MCG9015681.1 hypothetical protein [Laribacter hongkongensis]
MTTYPELVVALMRPPPDLARALAHCPELFTGYLPATRIAYDLLSTTSPDDHSRLVLVTIEEGMTPDMRVQVFSDAGVLLLEGEDARFALIGLDAEDAEAMLCEPVEVCVMDHGDTLFSLIGAAPFRSRKTP